MTGFSDLTGQCFGLLHVKAMVARHPSPRYSVICERCGTQSTAEQHDLSQGRAFCRNSACGRQGLHEEANMTLAQFRRREEQREQRKIDELKSQFEGTARRVAEAERRSLSHLRDDEFAIAPAVKELVDGMTPYERSVFTEQESQRFISENPDYYACPENAKAMTSYLERNDAARHGVITSSLLTAAFKRLDTYGMLKQYPAPRPVQVAPQSELENVPAVSAQPEPESMIGYDLRTGEQRAFSRYEVDRMGSEEFRRVFRVYRSALSLPNIGPGARRPR